MVFGTGGSTDGSTSGSTGFVGFTPSFRPGFWLRGLDLGTELSAD